MDTKERAKFSFISAAANEALRKADAIRQFGSNLSKWDWLDIVLVAAARAGIEDDLDTDVLRCNRADEMAEELLQKMEGWESPFTLEDAADALEYGGQDVDDGVDQLVNRGLLLERMCPDTGMPLFFIEDDREDEE